MDPSLFFALILAGLILTFWLLLRHQIKTARDDIVSGFRSAFREALEEVMKGHGYGDPSAAAVVTPSPSPGPVGELAPASAQRVALDAAPARSGSVRKLGAAPPSRSPAAVEAMVAEVQGRVQSAPVDTTGDRAGVNPGDALPDLAPQTPSTAGGDGRRLSSRPPPPVVVLDAPPASSALAPETETAAQIRARLEAQEEARSVARARGEAPALPTLASDDGDDERTLVKDAGDVRAAVRRATGTTPPTVPPPPSTAPTSQAPPVRRATLLGGLAGVPAERPVSSAARTAAEYRPRPPSSPTLISARGPEPLAPPPHPPILPPPLSETGGDAAGETERLYEEKRGKVRAMGLAVDHCQNGAHGCVVGDDDRPTPGGVASESWRSMAAPDVCSCNCGACRRATSCLLQAQREAAQGRRRG